MNSKELRQKFLDFFKKRGHTLVPSSSLIPAQDPTLLFTNAGMNQFKDLFLGKERRSYTNAVSIQKCVRAGGKHNDLDNVGFTKRHLTFFEMMGNFSFGDYFKREAINYAWDFLTKELGIAREKLHVSVFETDDVAYDIWKDEIEIPAKKIHRLAAEHNFWQMGPTGPCGPCSEIYIDRGSSYGCQESECAPGCDCDRFLEIWNLVFMQYDRQPDGTDVPSQTGIDTGMGLERLAAIMQNKDSVYQTDLFTPIIEITEKLTNRTYKDEPPVVQAAFHVLADHIRSVTFLIADGCMPSNDGRGYVLRKIIRRAALFSQQLSSDHLLFAKLCPAVVQEFKEAYPELQEKFELIQNTITRELEKFSKNLIRGRAMLETYISQHRASKVVSGEQTFKMYDTYGFPTELTKLIADEYGFSVDVDGFHAHMAKQKAQSGKKDTQDFDHIQDFDEAISTEFTGYHELETTSKVSALVHDMRSVRSVPAGAEVFVITESSPFFIVGGGQVPDQGWITINGHTTPISSVRFIKNSIAAQITTPVELTVGDTVTATVDAQRRTNAMKNHTATHLLQATLIKLFGSQIQQSGSLVDPDYLRFDFTFEGPISDDDIKKIETDVNQEIQNNTKVLIEYMTQQEAINQGALAFFGDKYNPEKVRVIKAGSSTELCGGTHVERTGDIGVFKITQIATPAAGQKRISAVTGPQALKLYQTTYTIVKTLGQSFKVKNEAVLHAVNRMQQQNKELQRQLKDFQKQAFDHTLQHAQPSMVKAIPFVYLTCNDMPIDIVKESVQNQIERQPGCYFVLNLIQKKPTFVAAASPSIASKINWSSFGSWLKKEVGLHGGGKNIIQGGGTSVDEHLREKISQWIEKQV